MIGIMTAVCMTCDVSAEGEPEISELYATSAVLMDADSGRVLYEKNGYEQMPMAALQRL